MGPATPPLPVGPVGPVAPVDPVGPIKPVAPVGPPLGPVGPIGPVGPVGPPGVPGDPVGPVGPVGPNPPLGPVGPVVADPVGPGDPVGPVGPTGPVGPVAPSCPVLARQSAISAWFDSNPADVLPEPSMPMKERIRGAPHTSKTEGHGDDVNDPTPEMNALPPKPPEPNAASRFAAVSEIPQLIVAGVEELLAHAVALVPT